MSAVATDGDQAPSRRGLRTWLGVLGAAVVLAAGGSAALLVGSSWPGVMGTVAPEGSERSSPERSMAAEGAGSGVAAAASSTATSSDASVASSASAPHAASPPRGTLSLVCEPRCEQVLVDDWTRGPSPISGLELDPGEHRVTLKRGDRPPKTIRVTIVAGEEARRVVPMSPPPDAGLAPSASASAAAAEPSAEAPAPTGTASAAPKGS